MQDRYAGDIGDYVKLALLRYLTAGRKLGIAWYLYPDEGHNADGRHIGYLSLPDRWRHLDPELFDALKGVAAGVRAVQSLEATGLIGSLFHGTPLTSEALPWQNRSAWRHEWFQDVVASMSDADIVFADPDNGLVDDDPKRRTKAKFGKSITLQEATALAQNRPAIIYHHNTRRPGGHDLEVEYWLSHFDDNAFAIRANAYSCRTFFVLNPDNHIFERAQEFCYKWSERGVRLHTLK